MCLILQFFLSNYYLIVLIVDCALLGHFCGACKVRINYSLSHLYHCSVQELPNWNILRQCKSHSCDSHVTVKPGRCSLLVESWIWFPIRPSDDRWFSCHHPHNAMCPTQHVLLGPWWPTWWYVSALWGCQTRVPPPPALRLLTHSWGHCVSVGLAGLLPAPPAAGKGTGACDYDLLPHLRTTAACVLTSAVTSNWASDLPAVS